MEGSRVDSTARSLPAYRLVGLSWPFVAVSLGVLLSAVLTLGYLTIRDGSPASMPDSATARPHQPIAAAPSAETVHARVGVYLLDLKRIDLTNNSYDADFYLLLRCQPTCEQVNWELMNGSTVSIVKAEDLPDYKVFRVQATLTEALDLSQFPFDRHHLTIALEDRLLDSRALTFEADPTLTGIDPEVRLASWRLDPRWSVDVRERTYPVFGTSYSQYVFGVTVTRPPLTGLLKGILPGCILLACGLVALFIPVHEAAPRISMTAGALIGSLVFHLNVASGIPAAGYLTLFDRFMLVNYVTLLMGLVAAVAVVCATPMPMRRRRVQRGFLIATPALWLVLQATNALL